MTWKPRLVEPEELNAVVDLAAVVFGVGPKMPDDLRKQFMLVNEVDRTFVIDDGPVIAGTAAAFSYTMAMPGGGTVPVSAVTEVGVRPTHRRQGMLRALMDAILDQAIERDEPVAGLTASEGGIYRRFGYGVAARFHVVSVDRTRSTEIVDIAAPGRLRMVDEGEAAVLAPAVWEQVWRSRPGEMDRSDAKWQALAVDPELDRDGATPRFVVVHEDPDGTPDGLAIYRIKENDKPVSGLWYELQVSDLAAVDPRVEAALVRYLLDVDLVSRMRLYGPVDFPLRWRLADSRAVDVVKERDHLWLRLLDVARCLAARSYAADGGAVIEVVDEARPELGGRFRLEAGPDGAECSRANGDTADVVVRTPELGAVLLGGVSWSTLQRAGLVDEPTAGAVDRLDALFRPTQAPFCGTDF